MRQVHERRKMEKLNQLLIEKWTNNFRPGYTKIKNFVLPQYYLKFQKAIDDFKVFDSDIWICGFPKTGTNWMAEMVWLIANNLNYEKGKLSIFERIRFLDFQFLIYPGEDLKNTLPRFIKDSINYTKNQQHPRFIKTHLPFQLLPNQIRNGLKHPKIIYITRNPMDVCVSYFYHEASTIFTGNLDEMCELFLNDKVLYGPFWDHVLPFWKLRTQFNIMFLKYEDMKEDLRSVIVKVAKFFEKEISDEELNILEKYLSFESMKEHAGVELESLFQSFQKEGTIKTCFLRSGTVNGYKSKMSRKYVDGFQNWMQKNLEGAELQF